MWILPEDDGGDIVMEMPVKYRLEMICDWYGAGKAQGTPGSVGWYKINSDKMRLHPNTRQSVEWQLFRSKEISAEIEFAMAGGNQKK